MTGDQTPQQAIRKLAPGKLVIASHNAGKVAEIAALLLPYGMDVVSAAELDLPEPEETGVSFVDNAELKALQAADLSGFPCLADDSGIAIEALNGLPGIHSARWAEPDFRVNVPGADNVPNDMAHGGRDFRFAMERVQSALEVLGPEASRDAHFVCALTLAWPDGHSETFEGRVDGTLIWPPRGDKGFGYDPIFIARGRDITFGEMEPDLKHRISHRADAFNKLVAAVF